MKLKVQNLKIATGGPFIVIINQEDAEKLDLHNGDRIRTSFHSKYTIAKVDIASDQTIVKKGSIGLFKELLEKLNVKGGSPVQIKLEAKPESIKYIRKKLEGETLTKKEIDCIISDIVQNKLDDIEITYFVAACSTRLMTEKETVDLTKAMIKFGDVLNFKEKPVIDKHCVGGVAGNRTTMVIVPIITAHGLLMPKTSSRSITSPAGTADTMECLADVAFSLKKIKKVIHDTHGCIVWGGAINLAPADDRIIRVEHPLSIDSRSQLIASILAKKASVSASHVLVDIPTGPGSKIENIHKATSLKRQFETIGKKVGMKIKCIITDGSSPIGNGFGPALEARDVLYVLKNDKRAPIDLKHKSIMMAGTILEMAGKAKSGKGFSMAQKTVESGRAYEQFEKIVKSQGLKTLKPEKLHLGKYKSFVRANRSGDIHIINNDFISKTARFAGAPKDVGAGILLHKHKNEKVKYKEILFTLYSNSKERLHFAHDFAQHHEIFKIR